MEIVYLPGGNCFENSLFTILNYYHFEYQLLLSNAYIFKIKSERNAEEKISSLISFDENEMLSCMEKYFPIKIEVTVKGSSIEMEKFYEKIKKKQPVLVMVDTFFCPHLKEQYRKYHMNHAFLVFACNEIEVRLLDPNIGNKEFSIGMFDFIKAVKVYYTFEKYDKAVTMKYREILEDSIHIIKTRYNKKNVEKLRGLMSDLPRVLREFEAYNKNEYQVVPLLLKFSNIGGHRNLYSQFLEYISEKTGKKELLDIVERIRYCASKWYLLRSIILKSVIHGTTCETDKEKIENRFYELQQLEDQCYQCIADFRWDEILQEQKEVMQHKNSNGNIKEFEYVNLGKLFNNKGMSYGINEKCDFTLRGQYFCDDQIPFGRIISKDQYSFQLPADELPFDNMVCNGQELYVREDYYSGLFILGCSENGSFFDYISVCAESNEADKVKISFPSWISDYSQNGVYEFADYKTYDSNLNGYGKKSKLYANYCGLDVTKKICKFVFPRCDNIHIVAVTLVK